VIFNQKPEKHYEGHMSKGPKQRMEGKDDSNLELRLNHAHCCDPEEKGTKHQQQMFVFHGHGTRLWELDAGVALKSNFRPQVRGAELRDSEKEMKMVMTDDDGEELMEKDRF